MPDKFKNVVKYRIGPNAHRTDVGGDVATAFRDMKRHLGKFPDFVGQTRPVNAAFKKAANKYVTGVRQAARVSFNNDTGRLFGAIKSKLGRAAFRPSSMIFMGGGRGSRHRNLVEHDWETKDGRSHKGRPYVEPGLKQANAGAVEALRRYIKSHIDEIVREASRIAERG